MSVVETPPNVEQLRAIAEPGVVFVSAGAGTGKTTVIVERFCRAVCERGLDVDSILVITYTERAAGELRARIRQRLRELGRHDLARDLDAAWISTIHGFCHRLLRAYPFEAGIDPRFRVVDDSQGRVLRGEAFRTALEVFCGDDPNRLRLLAAYGAYHSNCTPGYLNNEGITPENLVAAARSGVFMGSALDWAKHLQDWRKDGSMLGLQLTHGDSAVRPSP